MPAAPSCQTTTIRPMQTYTTCPSQWSMYNGHCYKVFNGGWTNAQAQAYCPSQQQNSYLAQIKTNDEYAWLQNFTQSKSTRDVWVRVAFILILFFIKIFFIKVRCFFGLW